MPANKIVDKANAMLDVFMIFSRINCSQPEQAKNTMLIAVCWWLNNQINLVCIIIMTADLNRQLTEMCLMH
ncbi:hypothetical protein PUG81_26370 [Erwiniaceae bacterium L1_54_6]|nr:hypothetical protein [Erwiniaceae bacterium L1_54_6]